MGSAPERLVVGRIAKVHGLNGEVVVEVLSDSPDRFAPGARVDVGDPDGKTRRLRIGSVRTHQRRLLVRFREIRDRTAAEPLRGQLLSIPAVDAAPLPEGRYYAWQLEGMEVVDEDGRRLGTLDRVLDRAGNDVWVVATSDGEALVPAVEEFVRSVDLDARRIVIHPIPGLFE